MWRVWSSPLMAMRFSLAAMVRGENVVGRVLVGLPLVDISMPLCVATIADSEVDATPLGCPSVVMELPVKVLACGSMVRRVSSQPTLKILLFGVVTSPDT